MSVLCREKHINSILHLVFDQQYFTSQIFLEKLILNSCITIIFSKNDVIVSMTSPAVQNFYIGLFLMLNHKMPTSSWLHHKTFYDVI